MTAEPTNSDVTANNVTAPRSAAPTNATEARARLEQLSNDKAWGAKVLTGDVQANRDFRALAEMAAATSADRLNNVLAGNAAHVPFEMITGHELTTHNLATAVDGLRTLGIHRPETIRQAIEGGPVTAEEHQIAKDALARVMTNKEFTDKLMAGDLATKRDWTLLHIIVNSAVEGQEL